MERPSKKVKRISKGNYKDSNSDEKKKTEPDSGTPVLRSIVIFSIVLLIGYQLVSLNFSSSAYVIILDAGSTGSRIFVPKFVKSFLSKQVKLEDTLFIQNKPGLSSFSDNPTQGAAQIASLLEKAKDFIPSEQWETTPLALRATAGLRLLPVDKAEKILHEVKNVISRYPFLSNDKSVAIMDGKDEGLFSWFTVNFLLDKLQDISKSVVTLDLGGGSVQITYIPKKGVEVDNKYLHPVSIFNQELNAYCYSYLGLGLMSVRHAVFLAENNLENGAFLSSCISPHVTNYTWRYGGEKYIVRGPIVNSKQENSADIDFAKCSVIVDKIVDNGNVHKPADIAEHDIAAFSYFFDRAAQFGLVDENTGGTVTVKDFSNAAISGCSKLDINKPLRCLDLIFISSLLKRGFGLHPNKKLQLLDTIDNHEISWALGAALHILENGL